MKGIGELLRRVSLRPAAPVNRTRRARRAIPEPHMMECGLPRMALM